MGERYRMLNRVFMILRIMENTPTGLSTRRVVELLRSYGLKTEMVTVRRDLKELEYLGFISGSLEKDEAQDRVLWKFSGRLRSMKNPLLSKQEIAGIMYLRRLAKTAVGAEREAMMSALGKIESLM